MKKLLFCVLAFAGICVALPEQAQARNYRHHRYYDDGGRYGGRYYRGYYDDCGPRYYSYRRPVRTYRYYDNYYVPRVRYYRAPVVSFSFGF